MDGEQRLAGVISVMPHGCMPGGIVAGNGGKTQFRLS